MVTVKSTQSWTSSNTFTESLNLLGIISLSGEINKQIQNTVDNDYKSQVTLTQNLQLEASFDDVLIVRRILYDITEVPVYIGNKLSGHILVVQPSNDISNNLLVTGGVRTYYNMTHVIGDVRTYPWDKPNDIDYSIFADADTVDFGNDYKFTVTSSTMNGQEKALSREQTTKVELKADLKFPFEIEGISGSLGFSASHSDTYHNTQVNTSQTQLTSTLEISISIPGYKSNSGATAIPYDVQPYIFWDSTGCLHISWSVTLPTNDWNNHITHPDPALRMPYMSSSFDGLVAQNLIFDVYTTPRGTLDEKQAVLITVTVFNYSYKQALSTTVEFYWTDTSKIPPNLQDSSKWNIIGNKTIETIGGFMNNSVVIPWYPKQELKSALLIVKLVSSGVDFDTSNNIGYSVWPQDSNNPLKLQHLLHISGMYKYSKCKHLCAVA